MYDRYFATTGFSATLGTLMRDTEPWRLKIMVREDVRDLMRYVVNNPGCLQEAKPIERKRLIRPRARL